MFFIRQWSPKICGLLRRWHSMKGAFTLRSKITGSQHPPHHNNKVSTAFACCTSLSGGGSAWSGFWNILSFKAPFPSHIAQQRCRAAEQQSSRAGLWFHPSPSLVVHSDQQRAPDDYIALPANYLPWQETYPPDLTYRRRLTTEAS